MNGLFNTYLKQSRLIFTLESGTIRFYLKKYDSQIIGFIVPNPIVWMVQVIFLKILYTFEFNIMKWGIYTFWQKCRLKLYNLKLSCRSIGPMTFFATVTELCWDWVQSIPNHTTLCTMTTFNDLHWTFYKNTFTRRTVHIQSLVRELR